MRKNKLLTMAVFCVIIGLFSCGKEAPELASTNSDSRSASLISVEDLEPNYVYTLAGTPDKYVQDDGVGDQASFIDLAQLEADDGYLYAVDSYVVRRIKISDRTVTSLAGDKLGGDHKDGVGKNATLRSPSSLALGPDGNIYVAELNQVSKVTKD